MSPPCPANVSICLTPHCATARKPTASTFTLDDKLAIAGMLDDLGIDYVEGGYPGANPTDTELFSQERKLDTPSPRSA